MTVAVEQSMLLGIPLFFLSIVAGGVGAISGMGGGVVLIPVLTLWGVEIKQAIALSALSVVAISTSAGSGYVQRHMPHLKADAWLEVFAVFGSILGASMAVAANRRLLYLLCGVLLASSWLSLWRQRPSRWGDASQPAIAKPSLLKGSYYDEAEHQTILYRGQHPWIGGFMMLGIGFLSGLVGFGSGALSVWMQDYVMRLPHKVSVTTSNLVIGVMALAGVSVYLEAGLIHPQPAMAVVLGIPIGTLIGSRFLIGLTNRLARLVFLAVLMVLGIEMLLHSLQPR